MTTKAKSAIWFSAIVLCFIGMGIGLWSMVSAPTPAATITGILGFVLLVSSFVSLVLLVLSLARPESEWVSPDDILRGE